MSLPTKKITALQPVVTPLSGDEQLECVQVSASRKVTTRDFVLPTDSLLTLSGMAGFLPGSRRLVSSATVEVVDNGPGGSVSLNATGGGGGLPPGFFEEGTLEMSLNGFAAPISVEIQYQKIADQVFMWLDGAAVTGVSNSTQLTLSDVPVDLLPPVNLLVPSNMVDDGDTLSGNISINIGIGVITFLPFRTDLVANRVIAAGGAFTSSGTKGLPAGWRIAYTL